jgi:hypothetical protein
MRNKAMTTQLDTSAKQQSATTGRGPARRAWHAISATIHEMNYATYRLAELNVHVPARPGA